jgi:hypothetical protein
MASQTEPEELAKEFLHELADQGEQLAFANDSETVVLKDGACQQRVPFWKIDLMVFNFLSAHALLTQVSVSDVLAEVLSMIT